MIRSSYLYVSMGWLCLVILPHSIAADRITGKAFATRSEVIAEHGAAATSHPLATQIALDILKQGGNAVDAAIGANAALALMEPVSCGLGGDLFVMLWDSESHQLHGLNGSGRSPKTLTLEEFQRRELARIPSKGVLPISVPGCVDGWFTLHERFGKLPMREILAPTIRYAREGFPVTELVAFYWEGGGAALADQPGFADIFLPEGRAPRKGQLFRNPQLADTLEKLAEAGRDAFYTGEIARTIGEFMREHGGFLTEEDLAAHRSEWVTPVSANYRGYDVWELPPNGQGIAALQMLNILEGYEFEPTAFGSTRHLHLLVEAKKLAFEDRAKFYSDPDFNEVPTEILISKPYANERRKLISLERAAKSLPAGNPAVEDGDTIYLTVADDERNMVSLIQSNYRGFGSGVCPPGLGFCLQNRGELFDLNADSFNAYAPAKRPFHTIIPAMITRDDRPWVSFGVMGGATQPQAHVQIVMNLIDFKMNLQEAGDAPRMVHEGSSEPTGERMINGGEVNLEQGFEYEVIRELTKRGHHIRHAVGSYGGYQAILFDAVNDVWFAASESRKDGQAAGY